jgi:hypothetical protein
MATLAGKSFAGVVELVDTLDLGSSASRRESSSLSFRTICYYGLFFDSTSSLYCDITHKK